MFPELHGHRNSKEQGPPNKRFAPGGQICAGEGSGGGGVGVGDDQLARSTCAQRGSHELGKIAKSLAKLQKRIAWESAGPGCR